MLLTIIIFTIIAWNLFASLAFKHGNILYCGLVGFSGSGKSDVSKLKMLLLSNLLRGDKGTGFYDGAGAIQKDNTNAVEFLAKAQINSSGLFIGHTRQPTVGNSAAVENCHPFEYDNIITAHNGTLTNHYVLCSHYNLITSDYKIDSQVLAKCLSLNNNYEALQRIDGTASVLFHNKAFSNKLYCFRKNEQRPLFRGMTKEGMYISSLKESLEMIGCDAGTIKEFKTGVLYEITDGKITESRPRKHIDTKYKYAATNSRTVTNHTSSYEPTVYGSNVVTFLSEGDICIFKNHTEAKRYGYPINQLMYVLNNSSDQVRCAQVTGYNLGDEKTKSTPIVRRNVVIPIQTSDLIRVRPNALSSQYTCGQFGVVLGDIYHDFTDTAGVETRININSGTPLMFLSNIDADGRVLCVFPGSQLLTSLSIHTSWVAPILYEYDYVNKLKKIFIVSGELTVSEIVAAKHEQYQHNVGYIALSTKTKGKNNNQQQEQTTINSHTKTVVDDSDYLDDDGFIKKDLTQLPEFDTLTAGTGVEYKKLVAVFKRVDMALEMVPKKFDKKNSKPATSDDIKELRKLLNVISTSNEMLGKVIDEMTLSLGEQITETTP